MVSSWKLFKDRNLLTDVDLIYCRIMTILPLRNQSTLFKKLNDERLIYKTPWRVLFIFYFSSNLGNVWKRNNLGSFPTKKDPKKSSQALSAFKHWSCTRKLLHMHEMPYGAKLLHLHLKQLKGGICRVTSVQLVVRQEPLCLGESGKSLRGGICSN